MVIVDLASGKAARVERVKRFAMPEKASGLLVYLKEGSDAPAGGAGNTPAAPKGEGDQQGGRGERGGAAAGAAGAGGRGARPEFGTDLAVRNLADSSERTITDVVEFTLTEDGKQVVYAVGARDSAKNGVFAVKPGSTDAPAALAEGKGKYAKLTWDENQTQVVFLSDRDDAAAKQPKWKLYRWQRQAPAASVLASGDMPGFRKEFVISDKGTLSFSKDGTRVFFACAPPAPDIVYTTGFPGQSAMKCVLPGVQAIVDKSFVKEDAIGIQGHSWGGHQIAYMVTQTKRFRAVAAGAPVADMISAYDGIRWGTGIPRQFQYERTQSRIGGSIWQYPTRFIENSPIFWADRVQTPVMLLHNDGDDAVPWYQGVEFYLALRRLGKEVYLFDYNGEPHGLRKRPNQKDYTIRLQQYFDHYLKGAPAPAWMEKGVPYIERERTELSTMGDRK